MMAVKTEKIAFGLVSGLKKLLKRLLSQKFYFWFISIPGHFVPEKQAFEKAFGKKPDLA
jgi:hypothetical protein